MNAKHINLYETYSVTPPSGAIGELYCYTLKDSREINEKRKKPAMLVIPGGGYAFTSDREAEPIAMRYMAYGYNAFVLRYSVAPVRFPYPLAEAIMAIDYIRNNADDLGVNPDMIAAVGFSAGGHLTGLLGSYYESPEAAEIFKPSVSVRPNAIILSYPVVNYTYKPHKGSFDNLCGDDEELKVRLSLENLTNEKSSPAFIWATYDDAAVPVANSLIAASAYEKAGVPFSIHVFGKGSHGLSLADETAYNTARYAEVCRSMTASVKSWVELSVEWLKEQGVFVKD